MAPKPETLAERAPGGTPVWAERLVRLLDDGFTIPGTRIGVGWDAVLGFVFPALGDALTGVGSLSLLVLAFQMRLPKVIVVRVIFNIAIDVVLGCLPFVGDAFDLFWRSNRRNLELLRRYAHDPAKRPDFVDYLLVGLGFVLVAAAVLLPLLLGAWLMSVLLRQF